MLAIRRQKTPLWATVLVLTGLSMPRLSAQPVRVAGLEHVGLNVPDVAQAVSFFRQTFGFEPMTDLGPYPLSDNFKRLYRVHSSAKLLHIVMHRAGDGPNLELFQYASHMGSKEQPHFDDIAGTHIAFYPDDIAATLAGLRAKHVDVLTSPVVNTAGPTSGETWFCIRTPWGSLIEFDSYPNGEAFEKQPGARLLWRPHRQEASTRKVHTAAESLQRLGACWNWKPIDENEGPSQHVKPLKDQD